MPHRRPRCATAGAFHTTAPRCRKVYSGNVLDSSLRCRRVDVRGWFAPKIYQRRHYCIREQPRPELREGESFPHRGISSQKYLFWKCFGVVPRTSATFVPRIAGKSILVRFWKQFAFLGEYCWVFGRLVGGPRWHIVLTIVDTGADG